jgi:hypothetical protein
MEQLNMLEPQLKKCVYRIVWWDYLADLKGGQMEARGELCQGAVPREDVIQALVQVGYGIRDAQRRMMAPVTAQDDWRKNIERRQEAG